MAEQQMEDVGERQRPGDSPEQPAARAPAPEPPGSEPTAAVASAEVKAAEVTAKREQLRAWVSDCVGRGRAGQDRDRSRARDEQKQHQTQAAHGGSIPAPGAGKRGGADRRFW